MASKDYTKGDFATFNGYPEGTADPILEAGQRVIIDRVNDDGGMIVFAVDEEGNYITDAESNNIGETCFPEELTAEGEAEVAAEGEAAAEPAAEAPAAEPVAETAAPAKKTAGKGKAPKAAAAPKQTKAEAAAEKKATEAKAKADAKAAAAEAKAAEKAAKQKAKDDEAAAKLAVAKPDNDDPLMIRVEQTQSVLELLKDNSALDAAKMLVNRAEQTDFTLGGVLHHIYITGAFKQVGYDGKRGFSDYVEKELGVQYRKARYLISIYTTFAQVFRAKGITEEDLLKLGWSKAKELARVPVNKLVEDYDLLMGLANDPAKPRDELISYINTNYEVIRRAETVQSISLNFKLIADAAEVVRRALAHAKSLAGEDADDNKALEYMAGDWLNNAEGTDTTLQQLIDLAAARFGVTLAEVAPTAETGQEAEAAAAAAA